MIMAFGPQTGIADYLINESNLYGLASCLVLRMHCLEQDRWQSDELKGGRRNGNDFLEWKSGASPLTDFSLILFPLEKAMKKTQNGIEKQQMQCLWAVLTTFREGFSLIAVPRGHGQTSQLVDASVF